MIPTVQALAFFVEIGPLVVGLLVSGRVGSGTVTSMNADGTADAVKSGIYHFTVPGGA